MEPKQFFRKYSDIAIDEMVRTGIPASITLAQAALESAWGESGLSKRANNFFGIKAHAKITGWDGDTINMDTLEYKPAGSVIESADFRAYTTPEESFKDHSEFLLKNRRYRSLFLIDPEDSDYIGKWTTGLQKSGYATDPEYAGKLQKIISRYNLTQYDNIGVTKKKTARRTNNIICPHCCNTVNIDISVQKTDC